MGCDGLWRTEREEGDGHDESEGRLGQPAGPRPPCLVWGGHAVRDQDWGGNTRPCSSQTTLSHHQKIFSIKKNILFLALVPSGKMVSDNARLAINIKEVLREPF